VGSRWVFLQLWQCGLAAYDALPGIDWAWLAMDGAMTNAPRGGGKGRPASHRSRDAGTKRRLRTDGGGVPIGLAVAGANRHDCTLVTETLTRLPLARPAPSPEQPQGLCLGTVSDYDEVRAILQEFGCTAPIRACGEEVRALPQEAGYRARRGVVERTPSWMNRFRRVWIRWDKKVQNSLAFLHLACAYITYGQAGLLG
jgi:putative transposase